MRLFHVSDLHFGREDQAAVGWFSECVRREQPNAIAITGDLTMRARRSEFLQATAWIQSLGPPVTVEMGNHDLPDVDLIARFFFPYRRYRELETLVEREIDMPGVSLVPLKTTARAQWRLNWSRGIVTRRALEQTLAAIAALPPLQNIIVTAHHPLVEAGTRGRALTRGGDTALRELAAAGVQAVLSGHVHDPFDLVHQTEAGPIRMIGAGTLSRRIRSTPPSFNELRFDGGRLVVRVRTREHIPTRDMQIDAIPVDADPPVPGDPVAPTALKPS